MMTKRQMYFKAKEIVSDILENSAKYTPLEILKAAEIAIFLNKMDEIDQTIGSSRDRI